MADGTVESQADVTISGHAGRRYLLVSPESNVEGVFVVAGLLVVLFGEHEEEGATSLEPAP